MRNDEMHTIMVCELNSQQKDVRFQSSQTVFEQRYLSHI
jgi:hypothetical protein